MARVSCCESETAVKMNLPDSENTANASRYEEMKSRLAAVPARPGVYLYKDKNGQVIYVGKAKSLRSRMRSYFAPADKLLPKVRLMVSRMHDFDYIVTSSEEEAPDPGEQPD